MEHFLVELSQSQGKDKSSIKHIHNRFVRFSKGEFNGPALKISRKGKTITLKGSIDFEEALHALVLDHADSVSLNGNILVYEDPSEVYSSCIPPSKENLAPLNTKNAKKGKWELSIDGEWTGDEARELFAGFRELHGYFLVKIVTDDKSLSFQVKTKPPQNKGDYEFDKAIAFCTAKLPNNGKAADQIVQQLLGDFKDRLDSFKEVQLENLYNIVDIEVPEDAKGNKRLAAIRKGTIKRILTVDGETVEKEFPFAA